MSIQYLFTNNATTTLAAPITASATTLTVYPGQGALFPSPTSGQGFTLTMTDAATGTLTEILLCTARSGDTFTVTRAQEGTSARSWSAGDYANNFITAGTAANWNQASAFGSAPGTYGTATQIPVITVNANGQMTAISTVTTTANYCAGGWNASTNTPTLVSSIGQNGQYYVVTTAGTTNLNGYSNWQIGDQALFANGSWLRVAGSESDAFQNITVSGLTGYMYANGSSQVTASTTIPNSGLAHSTITVNGTTLTLGDVSDTITANTPNALTFNNSGSGTSSGNSFNGGTALTVSYNTLGAPSVLGVGASGTWGISITGNAASSTITTNIAGGSYGSIPYQASANTTTLLPIGTAGQVLTVNSGATAPQWVNASSVVGGAGGSNTQIQYNSSGNLAGSANMTFNGTSLTLANDASIHGLTVGQGAGSVSTNTAVGASALATNSTGNFNVGIGANALLSNTTASSNTAVGYQAGYSNTTGTNLIAFGYQAGYGNTTANNNISIGYQAQQVTSTGANNIAIGTIALALNTTGASNIAVGTQALYSNTTASYQVAVGYQTGYSNTTGFINALGAQALYLNTTGSNNDAFGNSALYHNTTGSYNSAFGDSSLYNNTTASSNTAVGYQAAFGATGGALTAIGLQALYSNTAGGSTAIGYQAGYSTTSGYISAFGYTTLYSNTTGSNNAGFGDSALKANTTGSYNTAVGYAALYSNTTGSYNTALGVNALEYNTTASNNTAVGYQSLFNNTGGNGVAVGYQAGYSNTSGSVVAVGYQALYANTTGALNTAMGQSALAANTTGGSNVAMGYAALSSNTTGNANVGIGQQALNANTVANYNTAIGHQAGYQTTGMQNTFVGVQSGYYVTSGAYNTILGGYTGNQGGIDIRTSNNNIIISDGQGNVRLSSDASGRIAVNPMVGGWNYYGGMNFNGVYGVLSSNVQIWMNTGTTSSKYLSFEYNNNGGSGSITPNGASAISYNTSSDPRLKNITGSVTAESANAFVMALKPVTGTWKSDNSTFTGFLAPEYSSVDPTAVIGEANAVDSEGNPIYQQMEYGSSAWCANMTAALQSALTTISQMQAALKSAGVAGF